MLFAGEELKAREGMLIRLAGGDNTIVSWGEIAPLPGFSRESIGDVVKQLLSLRLVLKGINIPDADELIKLDGAFESWLGSYRLSASVRFGLETAVLQQIAKEQQVPLRKFISAEVVDIVPVCALLSGTNDQILKKAGTIRGEGYKAAKLKVGRQDLEDDITMVHTVREKIGTTMALRLDANRAWKIEQATTFMERVKDCNIEYIEEPARDYLGILQLCNRARNLIPIALDESLRSILKLDPVPGIDTIILKPTMLGFERAVQLSRRAAELGMKAIVSSSFESGLGFLTLAELAAALKDAQITPVGLDTNNSFAYDILEKSLEIIKGQINLTGEPARDPQPRFDRLEEVKDG